MSRETLVFSPRYEPSLQTIFFEIMDGTTKQACSLKVSQLNDSDAIDYFNQNWTKISEMVRESLNQGDVENGEIKLAIMA